jgi:hypothetical protein
MVFLIECSQVGKLIQTFQSLYNIFMSLVWLRLKEFGVPMNYYSSTNNSAVLT